LSELTLLWGSVDIDPGRNVITVAEARSPAPRS
jgi:hypothetical protein